ncbi:MAG: amidohydrolase family protein [Proteobacteria bacterium]|nr:amidohydrolase family protein [Pseudomonadota bacterium]
MSAPRVPDPETEAFLKTVPIVDPHQHFWDLTAGNPYPNLTDRSQWKGFRYGDKNKLLRDYFPDDLLRDAAPHNLVASVHIQVGWPGDPLGETRWLDGLRARTGWPTVALGQAELHQPNVGEVLAGHAQHDFMRGVRTKPTQYDDPRKAARNQPGSMDDKAWRRGFELLAKHDFVCDVQVPYWYLDQIADLAAAYPGTRIGINHTALPADRTPEGLAAWRRALELVAPLPNVHLKVSGIGVPPGAWPVEENLQIVRDAISIMGWQRCMFASNFPVDELCGSYDTIYSTFKRAVADRPHAEIRALFHDNARSFYRIPIG